MKANLRITKPDEVEATISVTMTLGDWKLLRAALAEEKHYEPGGKLKTVIEDLVRQATRAFYPADGSEIAE